VIWVWRGAATADNDRDGATRVLDAPAAARVKK